MILFSLVEQHPHPYTYQLFELTLCNVKIVSWLIPILLKI